MPMLDCMPPIMPIELAVPPITLLATPARRHHHRSCGSAHHRRVQPVALRVQPGRASQHVLRHREHIIALPNLVLQVLLAVGDCGPLFLSHCFQLALTNRQTAAESSASPPAPSSIPPSCVFRAISRAVRPSFSRTRRKLYPLPRHPRRIRCWRRCRWSWWNEGWNEGSVWSEYELNGVKRRYNEKKAFLLLIVNTVR